MVCGWTITFCICISIIFEEIALVFNSDPDSYSFLALLLFPPFSFVYGSVGFLGFLGDQLGNQLTTIIIRLYRQQCTIGVLSKQSTNSPLCCLLARAMG